MNLYLPDGDARRLLRAISLLHEWLGLVDEYVLDDLAGFGFYARLDPRHHLQQLLDDLAAHAETLRRQLPTTTAGAS
jgi:hypothetical protein